MNKNCGIYKITNGVNNKVYIGQSVNLKQRQLTHFGELRNNNHYNSYLQRSFNKYKEIFFEFEIIENCDKEKLYERENYWISYYKSYIREYGYNNTLPPKDGKKYSMSDVAKQKLSNAKRVFENEELLSYLEEYYYHYGKIPTQRDIVNTKGFPSNHIFYERFGSFGGALDEIGLYDLVDNRWLFERKEYTREEVLSSFKEFISKHNRFPSNEEYRNATKNSLPSFKVVMKHFNSLEELRDILEITKESEIEKERQEALNALYNLYIQDGKVTSRTIDKSSITRSTKYYSENFGSLVNAYKLAGVKNFRTRAK